MATTKYAVDEQVWVPSAELTGDYPYALVERKVLAQVKRSVIVSDRDGETAKISSRLVHPINLGFLVLRLGDLSTERTLLDPLAKSVLQYLRLLIRDDAIFTLHARTDAEIVQFMKTYGAAISHVILVGHGSSKALKLMGDDNWLPVARFVQLLSMGGANKTLISLACSTGKAVFGRTMSESSCCKEFVAPYSEVHGASASLYVQCLLHAHLLHGHEFRTAARLADGATEGTQFNHWRDGKRLVPTRLAREATDLA